MNRIVHEIFTWKLEGDFPEVPLAEGVNLEDINAIDADPLFLTLPIAEDGKTSSNGMVYTEAFNNMLVDQIVSERTLGNLGHISWPDSEVPMSPVIWVGATHEEGKVWAKGFVWEAKHKEFFKALKASNSNMATSIYGFVEEVDSYNFDADTGTYWINPDGFELEYIDVVTPKRAALQLERPQFNLTKHSKEFEKEEKPMNIGEVLAQLKPDQYHLIPVEVREAILNEANSESQIAELREKMDGQVATIEELNNKLTAVTAENRSLLVVNTIAENMEVDSKELHDYLFTMVMAQLGDRDVEEVVSEVMESEAYKTLAKAVVAQLGGPNIERRTSNNREESGPDYERYEGMGLLNKGAFS